MLNSDYKSKEQDEAIRIALAIIDDRMNAIEGCRHLIPILYHLGKTVETYEPLKGLIGVDSQTDHIPFGKSRDRYSKKYLDELDRELEECMRVFKDDIVKDCREILKDLSETNNPRS